MKFPTTQLILLILAVALLGTGGVPAAEDSPLPRVLLIGDSICGGYQKGVKKQLAGQAEVVKNAGNAQHTRNGLEKIDAWIGDGKWDVIHFNWGLWDIAHRNPKSKNFGRLDKVDGTLTTPLPEFEKNLRALVARLRKTDATLIWASITPVPDGEPGRIKGDEIKYNAVAAKIMQDNGIAINDLHAEVLRLGRPKRPDVHDTGNLSGKVTESILAALASDDTADATPVARLQAEFRKLDFGMFLHYNMATYKNAQWVVGYPDPSTFDPGGKIDTDAWADAAVAAGMKYGVLTVKHVAGFCLWDSEHTTYDVMHPDCPYQQDLVAQFIKSFKSRGLKVGLYYCWRHPGFKADYKVLPPECDPAKHDLKAQIEFQKKQIAELIEKYPDVFYIWNDALDDKIMTREEANAFVRSLGPNILASSNWWDWGRKGTPFIDIAVKETRHFPEDNKAPGETCWKIEQGWFWQQGARSGNAKGILGHMDKVRARNSNFLLNVGPDMKGNILPSSVQALKEIGELRKARKQ